MFGSEPVVDPAARDKYLLEVTAGPSYDPATHQQVAVNSSSASCIESDIVTAWIKVRIKDYNGLPRGSPTTSDYFNHRLHTSDRYSVGFSYVPKADIPGKDLVMGFDYDHSIKNQLPPGFKYAMKIATSLLDPGLYSDPYSDEPYLYGPALSSFFAFQVGESTEKISAEDQLKRLEQDVDGVVEEGAQGSGQAIREELSLPSGWKKRRKHFLNAQNLESFVFEKGRMYHADFFNPHLDFANFSLRLPGFSISIAKYIDEKTHHLRFVLKNRQTEEVLFVVFFKLLFGRELDDKLEDEKKLEQKEDEPVVREGRESQNPEPETLKTPPSVTTDTPSEQLDGVPTKGDSDTNHTASAATTTLADSIYAIYAALGFADSPSSASETSSKYPSPDPSSRSIEAQIDDMDDAAIESYLQSLHGSVK